MKFNIFLFALLVMFLASPAYAGGRQGGVFNFIYQNEAAIDENSARIDELEHRGGIQTETPALKQLYANGEPVGIIIDDNINLTLEFNSSFEPVLVGVNGTIKPELSGNYLRGVYFSEPDCQGEAYVINDYYDVFYGHVPFKLTPNKGRIHECPALECRSSLYYRYPGETNYYHVSTASKSIYTGKCANSETRGYFYKVLPNDPAVTGIKEYPFPLPLTFEGMDKIQMKLITR